MTVQRRIGAVFFDLDGTLIDSEPLTDVAILRLLGQRGLPAPDYALSRFHGVTWERIVATLANDYPDLDRAACVNQLQAEYRRLLLGDMPPFIAGAPQAFVAASRECVAGVVSSSPRDIVATVLEHLGLRDVCRVIVGAEDVQRSKPDPECYLLAAERAGVDARRCLAFEDSPVGLQAARTAGMYAIGIVGNRDSTATAPLLYAADRVIRHFDELPADFFSGFEVLA